MAGALASFLPRMRVDNSDESFLHPDDPAREVYDAFRDRFGQDESMVIAVHPPAIFDLGFLAKLRAFHEEIEREIPYVEEVTSLVNARYTHGDADELVVEDLLEDWPETQADVEAVRARVRENPLYENTLISADGTFTAVVVKPFVYSTLATGSDALAGFGDDAPGPGNERPPFLSEAETEEFVHAAEALLARWDAPDFQLYATGGDREGYHLNQLMQRDVTVFLGGSVLVIMAVLFLLFRRASAVVVPTVVVVTALLATLGVMVLLDIPSSVTGQMIPALLLTVGTCDSIHILAIYYQRLAAGEARDDAISFALGHSGLAVLMTSLTTAGGLVSFAAAELAPIAHVGVVAPIGILLAFVYSVTLLPALLAVWPARRSLRGERIAQGLGRVLAGAGDLATARPRTILAGAAALTALALAGVWQLRFSHDAIRWFPEDDPIRISAEFLDAKFAGLSTLEVVIDSGRENGLHEPENLARIEAAMRFAEAFERPPLFVGKATSLVDVVKETHKALNENRTSHYVVPDDRRLVAQELLLFENSGTDDLEDVTDTRFRLARLTLRTPWEDAILFGPFIDELSGHLREILGPDLPFYTTGMSEIFSRTFAAVIASMARSYVIALFIITPLMILLIGRVGYGLLSMVPNLVPILFTLGLMGWLGWPLDGSNLLVGSIILGLAVDDTIHFMHKFWRYYEETGDPRTAVHRTLVTTGSALLFTSLVLAAGFLVISASYMENTTQFGLLASFATVVAFLADILLGPALMAVAVRPRGARASLDAEPELGAAAG